MNHSTNDRGPFRPAQTERLLSRRSVLSAGALFGAGALAAPLLTACSTPDQAGSTSAGSGPTASKGIGTPTTEFPAKHWNPSALAAGAKPDLPKRIAFQNVVVGVTALEAVDKWMRQAAADIKFEYLTSNSNGNSAQTITQINQAIARGVMGMVAPGQDLKAQVAAMQANMQKGGAMFLFNSGGVTCGMAAVQYQFGHRIGEYAARYIKDELGGDAKVAFLNLNVQLDLRPRETGFVDAIVEAGLPKELVTSIAAPAAATQENGFKLMNTLLQKQSDYNIVASAGDDLALGAMAALKAAGKWQSIPKLMVCGIDGNTQAVAAVKAANSPFKATSAAHFPMVGYAPGRLIERWANGLSIPQYLEYQSFLIDSPDAAATWDADQSRCPDLYEQMLDGDTKYIAPRGQISFETRGAYYQGDLPIKMPDLQS